MARPSLSSKIQNLEWQVAELQAWRAGIQEPLRKFYKRYTKLQQEEPENPELEAVERSQKINP